jgi:hypothetical protein
MLLPPAQSSMAACKQVIVSFPAVRSLSDCCIADPAAGRQHLMERAATAGLDLRIPLTPLTLVTLDVTAVTNQRIP